MKHEPTPEEMQSMCPSRWAGHIDCDLRPTWVKRVKLGQNFNHCPSWANKANCWAKWFDERREATMSAPNLKAAQAQAKRMMAAYDQLDIVRKQACIEGDGQTIGTVRGIMDRIHSYAGFVVDVQHDPALTSR